MNKTSLRAADISDDAFYTCRYIMSTRMRNMLSSILWEFSTSLVEMKCKAHVVIYTEAMSREPK